MMNLKTSKTGSITTDKSNHAAIAKMLLAGMSCFFTYELPNGAYDVFLKYRVDFGNGGYQRGMRQTDLFIGLPDIGFFSFEPKDSATSAESYDETFCACLGQEFYDLLNGIRAEIYGRL